MSSSGGQVTLVTGDLALGGVEIKDGDTDLRADVEVEDGIVPAGLNGLVIDGLAYVFDGVNWVRQRMANVGDNATASQVLAVTGFIRGVAGTFNMPRAHPLGGLTLTDGVPAVGLYHENRAGALSPLRVGTDAADNTEALFASAGLWNGSSLDRARANAEATVLASASNAAGTRTSADQTNFNARGVLLVLDITALGAAETLTLIVDAKDPVSGIYIGLTAFVDVGVDTAYTLYPGAVETAAVVALQVQGVALPRTWRVRVTTAPAVNASTFSVGASYIL